jgi:streptomycin 6-kinase
VTSALNQLKARAQQWNVAIEKTWETDTSVLAFGSRENSAVVLKISKQFSDEWYSGDILRAFDGAGVVKVYESEPGAVLLERLVPGGDLVDMVKEGNDDEATEILAAVMRQLANHDPPDGCTTVLDWEHGFDRYLKSDDKQIPATLVAEGQKLFQHLASSSSTSMLLHGDLQHYNVLFDANRGWVAIDPKGVVGELEYEVGAMIRNPVELPDFFTSRAVIERRLRILTNRLHLDYRRALQWSFAQAVLSAIWDVEDGFRVESNHPALMLAQRIKPMLS